MIRTAETCCCRRRSCCWCEAPTIDHVPKNGTSFLSNPLWPQKQARCSWCGYTVKAVVGKFRRDVGGERPRERASTLFADTADEARPSEDSEREVREGAGVYAGGWCCLCPWGSDIPEKKKRFVFPERQRLVNVGSCVIPRLSPIAASAPPLRAGGAGGRRPKLTGARRCR